MPTQPAESHDTFWRSLHALNVTRILIATLLFIFWGLTPAGGQISSGLFSYRIICIAYLALAVVFALFTLQERRHFMAQLLSQIVVDILVVSLLYVTSGGIKGGMAILFLFPLAGAAILVQLILGLFFASIVTLFLLLETWSRILQGQSDAPITQAGLYGGAFFSAVYVVNRLAAKLITQEKLAIQHGLDLQIQQAINRLIIADMDDGVIVVGIDGTIYACNPSAEHQIGLALSNYAKGTKLANIPYLKPLTDAFLAWHKAQKDPARTHIEPIAYLILKPSEDHFFPSQLSVNDRSIFGTHLKVRFATATTEPLPKDRYVIFLQDVARIENQAQQLKLASMGRLTASIAHEVRNPLAAIAHASALMGEDANTPAQQRLLKIVSDNVARMNRMIEDILNLSRKAQSQELIVLRDLVADIKASFEEINNLADEIITTDGLDAYQVRFDPVHLREVLLNLLSNALRYASGQPGSIRIHAVQATISRLELHVQDDGPFITAEVRAHLFEPFYTTSSRGTGLGLYLARELCSNNEAMLDYEFYMDAVTQNTPTGRFVITFAASDMNQEGFAQ